VILNSLASPKQIRMYVGVEGGGAGVLPGQGYYLKCNVNGQKNSQQYYKIKINKK